MIRPLRRAHFRVWIGLTALLLAVLVLGVATRRSAAPRNANFSWESQP